MKRKHSVIIISTAAMMLWPAMAKGDIGDAGLEALASGQYEEAAALLADDIDSNPRAQEVIQLYAPLGEALIKTGRLAEAKERLMEGAAKGAPEATLMMGRLSFEEYDFDGAAEWYGKYARLKNKGYEQTEYSALKKKLDKAREALATVEKIVVIDSISVPADTFFEAYRLPASAGALLKADAAPEGAGEFIVEPVFRSEDGHFMMWGEEDPDGVLTLAEAVQLTDGGWHLEHAPREMMNGGGDAGYPFMMADGTTLYYANDGEDSMGGYDIFIASRDAQTGEYMIPQNIGMPFNSPSDDYMLAIDEENGIGWWATDRNHIPGEVTVYVYIPNESRSNHDGDDEEVIPFARIASFRDTWEGEDYSDRAAEIKEIGAARKKKADFRFPLPDGRIITSYDDISSSAGKSALKAYFEKEGDLDKLERQLSDMRRKYEGNKNFKSEVLRLEKEVEAERLALKKLRNAAIKNIR